MSVCRLNEDNDNFESLHPEFINNQSNMSIEKKIDMSVVYISIGSNINPQRHIKNALKVLQKDFNNVHMSSVFESKSVGFQGGNFLNLVVRLESELSVGDLNNYLHTLEDKEGRERTNGKDWDSRTLDLDILLFDDIEGVVDGVELPRDEILEHAHVLKPLAEIAGNLFHQPSEKSYAQLDKEIVFEGQEIWHAEL